MDFILSLAFGIILFFLCFDLYDRQDGALYNVVVGLLMITIITIFGFLTLNTLPNF
jgi:uncharacterized membrane protein